ncbi:hypothetical protein F0562_010255 [Nyssa sinensis]|uniref:Uncharacterized protein n=1 Tax=Nyssa sinensis TaxID=561372 RepID=A0A5J5A224_9ASTE|nr:hypothetical protein F0562_010255 [Nyssa sinensis]
MEDLRQRFWQQRSSSSRHDRSSTDMAIRRSRRLVDRRDSGGSSAGGCGGEGDVVTIASVFENRAEQVIQAKAEVEKGCSNGWCPVVKSRYSLNRKAKKMIEVIELQRNVNFDRVSYPAPPTEMGSLSSGGFKGLDWQGNYRDEQGGFY